MAKAPARIPFLDKNMYLKNFEIVGHFAPGELRRPKMQMMSRGKQRLLFQNGDIIDVTNPAKPEMVNKGAYEQTLQPQLAFHQKSKRWIMMNGIQFPALPGNKYEDPSIIRSAIDYKGLRGVRIYDVTDPLNVQLICEYSTGQAGGSTHRSYWDGGRYAYLTAGPDDTFIHMERYSSYYTLCLVIVDMTDPTSPKEVSRWWVPGQRVGEEEAYQQWPEYGDQESFSSLHGPVYVPKRVEDGGNRGYGAWGSLGMIIHDLSDIEHPRLVSRFNPGAPYGTTIAHHTIWPAMLDRNIVLINPEVVDPDERQEVPIWVVDVSDERNPVPIATFPRPVPPAEAPYKDFAEKHGRFGTHNPPHLKAPGQPRQDFITYTWFNAGIRSYDLTDPYRPFETGYFIPPQGGDISIPNSSERNTDSSLIEWDRNVIYVGTDTGIYVLSTPQLGKPMLDAMPVAEWYPAGVNAGAP